MNSKTKKIKDMSQKNKKRNLFTNFIWYASGQHLRDLSSLSQSKTNYFAIGGVNIFITTIVFLLTSWSFHVAFPKVISIIYYLLGITLGIIVFTFNRQTIHALCQSELNGKNQKLSIVLIPIVLFSIFFGIIISTPIKFYLFDISITTNIMERISELDKISGTSVTSKISSWSLTIFLILILILPTLIKFYSLQNGNQKKRSNFLNEFMWFCSGANKEILRKCPNEYAKYFGIGGTILFTALMATISGGYAFYTAFDNPTIAISFGLFWGAMIFNLDRFIVNTMYSDGEPTISIKELLGGLPRLIIAIFLGIVISYPLELKLFEDEINARIEKLKVENLKEYNTVLELSFSQIGSNNKEVKEISIKKDNLQNEINKAKQDWESVKKVAKQGKRQKKDNTGKPFFDNSNKPIMETYTYYVWPEEYYHKKKDYEDIKQRNELDIEDYRNKIKNIENKIIADEKVKEGYELSHNKQNVALSDLSTRMEAFEKLKEEKSSIRISSLFIMLLLIIIEIAPVLFKMMMTSGDYEVIQNAERNEIKVTEIVKISERNDWANTEITKLIEDNKKKIIAKQNELNTELNSNHELLLAIAKAQAEIAQVAINKWKEQEIQKALENPESFIKMNT